MICSRAAASRAPAAPLRGRGWKAGAARVLVVGQAPRRGQAGEVPGGNRAVLAGLNGMVPPGGEGERPGRKERGNGVLENPPACVADPPGLAEDGQVRA